MIAIGMIVGSDYTKGISNAGIMTAIEILQEFHGTCMERLEKFRFVNQSSIFSMNNLEFLCQALVEKSTNTEFFYSIESIKTFEDFRNFRR